MSLWSQIRMRAAARLARGSREAELEEELSHHLEQDVARRIADGVDPEAARRQARIAFGSIDRVREECREAWGTRLLDELLRDLTLALRGMRRQPLQSLLLVFILAVGVAGTTASFGLVSAYLWQPLPFHEPDRLVHLYREEEGSSNAQGRFALADLESLARDSATLAELGAYTYTGVNLRTEESAPVRSTAAYLTPDLLELLGVRPVLGQSFAPRHGEPGQGRVVLLGTALHRDLFGSADDALGATLQIDGVAHTVLGILPDGFSFPFGEVRLWLPVEHDLARYPDSWENFQAVARLRPEATREAAAAELSARLASLDRERGRAERRSRVAVWPLRKALIFLFELLRATLLLVLLAHLALLLVIASNVGGILLARLRVRERDLAIRAALGAGRRRLVAQLVTEAALFLAGGGALGVALAAWLTPRAGALVPEAIFRSAPPRVDLPALAFALACVATAALLAAVLPALRVTRASPSAALQSAGRGSSDRASHRLRDRLVLAQVAVASTLAIVGIVLGASVVRRQAESRAIAGEHVLTLEVELSSGRFGDDDALAAYRDRLHQDLAARDEIRRVALVDPLPMNFETYTLAVEIVGPKGDSQTREVAFHRASEEFFDVFGQPLRGGRVFAASDRMDTPAVAVVSESFRDRFYPDRSPLGERLRLPSRAGAANEWVLVVGIVADSPTQSLDGSVQPTVYLPIRQSNRRRFFLAVETTGDAERFREPLRRWLGEVDPDLPTTGIRSLPQVLSEALAPWAIGGRVSVALAIFALALAGLGLYGVVAQGSTERRFELGLRAALGATPQAILRLVLRDGIRLVALGLLLGLLLSLAATQLLRGVLGSLSLAALAPAIAVPVLLALAALAAMLQPALRAMRVDPALTLRSE